MATATMHRLRRLLGTVPQEPVPPVTLPPQPPRIPDPTPPVLPPMDPPLQPRPDPPLVVPPQPPHRDAEPAGDLSAPSRRTLAYLMTQ